MGCKAVYPTTPVSVPGFANILLTFLPPFMAFLADSLATFVTLGIALAPSPSPFETILAKKPKLQSSIKS